MNYVSLNPLELAFQGQQLIEASAGTGKTYTLSALYVRLILGHNQLFDQGLRLLLPPDILVMTFTEAATAELRERIRLRLQEAKLAFEMGCSNDDFLSKLLAEYSTDLYPVCVQKLSLAIEWMDEAAIFTIHGWASRMLKQHAFDSLSLFEQTLVEDTYHLKLSACKDYWRQVYYSLDENAVAAVTDWVNDPEALLKLIQNQGALSDASRDSAIEWIEPHIALSKWGEWKQKTSSCFKQLQAVWTDEVNHLLAEAKAAKQLNGTKYRDTWLTQLKDWLITGKNQPTRDQLSLVSTGGFVPNGKAKAPQHLAFDVMLTYVNLLAQEPEYKDLLLNHARTIVREIYQKNKAETGQFDFDDLLHQLYDALQGEAGASLAQAIRQQFPVALVDEFQDTDPWQYGCLVPIYQHREDVLLLMIGDPKQAIYRFRGADMNTYLRAREDASHHHTLTQNFRSTKAVIDSVNVLFSSAEQHTKGAFQFKQGQVNPIPFVNVNAGKQDIAEFQIDQKVQAAITVWAFQTKEKPSKQTYLDMMTQTCANEIQNFLESKQTGFKHKQAFRHLVASDIAVLVRSRTEAILVKQALAKRGISSVYLSDKDSIFSSEEAKDIWRWLLAVNEPASLKAIKNALASRSFANSLSEFDRLTMQEFAWDEWVNRFTAWRDIWQQQGVQAMLYSILHEQDIAHYWQQQAEGERRLTNLLQLAELLQKASLEREGRLALIRWLADHINQPQASTAKEHLIRLESDASCVTLITVHKSKGLEYPLVFLPFAMTLAMNKKQVTDEAERLLDWQESIRLLYVALTRASHALWIGATEFKPRSDSADFHESALGYLLAGEPQQGTEKPLKDYLDHWQSQCQNQLVWIDIQSNTQSHHHSPLVQPRVNISQIKHPALPNQRNWPFWNLTSYSKLTRNLVALTNLDSSSQSQLIEDILPSLATETDWQQLPASSAVGDMMHKALETLLTEALIDQETFWQTFWQQQLTYHQIKLSYLEPFNNWLNQLYRHPIELSDDIFSLSLLSKQNCWIEMSFTLPMAQTNTAQVDTLISRILLNGKARPSLSYHQLGGMLTGFLDCVFEFKGRFYVMDYKTNKLAQGYDDTACQKAMLEHRYDVQAMIYLLALHRLLENRLPNYDFNHHLGGAIYWFVRGANLQLPQQGIWQFKPSLDELEAFSDLFRANRS